MKFDQSTDLLVVGSGGGALTSALTTSIVGADAIVVEKTPLGFVAARHALGKLGYIEGAVHSGNRVAHEI